MRTRLNVFRYLWDDGPSNDDESGPSISTTIRAVLVLVFPTPRCPPRCVSGWPVWPTGTDIELEPGEQKDQRWAAPKFSIVVWTGLRHDEPLRLGIDIPISLIYSASPWQLPIDLGSCMLFDHLSICRPSVRWDCSHRCLGTQEGGELLPVWRTCRDGFVSFQARTVHADWRRGVTTTSGPFLAVLHSRWLGEGAYHVDGAWGARFVRGKP